MSQWRDAATTVRMAPRRGVGPGPSMSVASDIRGGEPRFGGAMARRVVGNLLAWIWTLVSFRRVGHGRRLPAWSKPGRLVAAGLIAVGVIAVAMLFLDVSAITHQRALPRWVVVTFDAITDFGRSGWVLIPTILGVVLIAVLCSSRIGRTSQLVLVSIATRLGFVFLAVGIPGLVVTIVKRAIGRARPYSMEAGGAFDFNPFNWHVAFASLPSGHGTTAFAAAFAIGALYPRWRMPLWTFAILIALSRVAVSAHYPSDVLAGALVGVLGALLVRYWFAARRLAFAVALDGSVQTLPGPSWRRVKHALRRLAPP